jgi:hypothetical protein
MPKTKIKRQSADRRTINTGEPIEEKELDLNPLAILAPDGEEKEDEDDELGIDDDEIDPFKDKWEQ